MSKLGNQLLAIAQQNPDVRIGDEPAAPKRGKTEAHRKLANKFGANKTVLNGQKFDSKAEAKRFGELRLLSDAGLISDLVTQPEFVLQEGFEDAQGRKHRGIKYVADFAYTDKDGNRIVEDVKGGKATQTPAFRIKFKLAIAKYPNLHFRVVGN